MATYQQLMPNLNTFYNMLGRLTNFTLPTQQLQQIGSRAAQEARTIAQPRQTALNNIRRSLEQQRAASLQSLQAQASLLPQLFQRNLRNQLQQVALRERQRGVQASGLGLRNMLQAGGQVFQDYAGALQQNAQQRAGVIEDFIGNLLSRVFYPQRELAEQQGQDALQRYSAYINQAYEHLYQGRIQQAELALQRAQLEYDALARAAQEQLLRQQMAYVLEQNRAMADYDQRWLQAQIDAQRRALSQAFR